MKKISLILKGYNNMPICMDIHFIDNKIPKNAIIFSHGFKGFKDWGHFNLIAKHFAKNNFLFAKFNFSHNGTSPDNPADFVNLEAFGHNTYSKELYDLNTVVEWIYKNFKIKTINLMGHSRGGGISILHASKDNKINKLVTWASVYDFYSRLPNDEKLKEWKEKGVFYVFNSRTKQNMPMYYEFVEDLLKNKKVLSIPEAEKSLKIPHLIIHGTNDESVSIEDAYNLHKINPKSELYIIKGANHTFGGKHPYNNKSLPEFTKLAIDKTINFLRK